MASAIDKTYIFESAKISTERIFANVLAIEGLRKSGFFVAYDVLTQDTRKFESFSRLSA